MTIQEMHYDIKKKLNKVDSQQFRNLLVPEIDIAVNEAIDLFVKIVAFPRFRTQLGFEKSQRSIDDIRSLVEDEDYPENQFDVVNNQASLPEDYMFYISSFVKATKGGCTAEIDVKPVQHDDKAKTDVYAKSSYEWRQINAEFNSKGIKFLNDGSFEISKFYLSYIRRPKYVHNAESFNPQGYVSPSGTQYEGRQNCELPRHTHTEITDLAVMLLSGELKNPGHELTIAKLKMNQLN